jgi:hypothetical protein
MLKLKNVSKKHWFDTLKWDMVVIVYGVLLNAIKVAFVATAFIRIFTNKITMIEIPNGCQSTYMWSKLKRGWVHPLLC